jgi:hypothetical protein
MAKEGLITLNDLLTRFRASGVYTVYRDSTKAPVVQSQQPIRLIPGYSKIGLFNSPVFIEQGDFETAERIFGSIDPVLERKGSWFQRSLRIALEEGSVFALNLLKTNNEVDVNGNPTSNSDVAEYKSFSTDIADSNKEKREKLLASYYNKERFWFADPNYLLATRSITDQGSILNLTNLSQNPITFLLRKSEIKGFDISVKDWFVKDELIPFICKKTDLISDYMIDIVAINGDFTDYNKLAQDPIFGQYFDNNGLIKSKLEEFLSLTELSVKEIFTGCLIPEFVDKNGTPLYIEEVVNNQVTVTGVLCAIDRDELDKYENQTNDNFIDLVGHRLLTESVVDANFLSYKRKLLQDFTYETIASNELSGLNLSGVSINSSVGKITVTVNNTNPDFDLIRDFVKLNTAFKGVRTTAGTNAGVPLTNPVLFVTKILKTTNQITFDVSNSYKSLETSSSGSFVNLDSVFDGNYTELDSLSAGDLIELKITRNMVTTTIGTYTVLITDSTSSILNELVNSVNPNTNIHQISASFSGNYLNLSSALPDTEYTVELNTVASQMDHPRKTNEGLLVLEYGVNVSNFQFEQTNERFLIDGTSTYYLADIESQIYKDYKSGQLTSGDKISDSTNTYYIKFDEIFDISEIDGDGKVLLKISLFVDQDLTIPISSGNAIGVNTSLDSAGFVVTGASLLNFVSLVDSINQKFDCEIVDTKIVRVDISLEGQIKTGQYLSGFDENDQPIMARILSIKRYSSTNTTPTHLIIETDNRIKIFNSLSNVTQIERFVPIKEMFTHYDLTVLKGFTVKESHMPNGTNQRMREIYSVMTDTSLATALTDPEMINFRYMVDTFNHGLEPQSKRYLSKFVKTRQKCLGLLNTPTVDEFRKSSNPRFTTTPTPTDPLPNLDIELINKGGNLDENPTFLYTLPDEADGASFVGFFFPNIEITDASNRTHKCVPAPLVSNNFIRKYRANPFLAVAGPNRGIITGDGVGGVTYPLSRDNRGALEEKGINPIYRKSNGDIQINGNETAYKKFKSILNNLNARDTLITLEIDIENIMDGFLFENNDDTLRTQVESSLTAYLDGIRDTFGAIVSYSLIFDRTNNPFWVVREGASIVDIEVVLPEVAKKFIIRTTLSRGLQPVVGSFIAV